MINEEMKISLCLSTGAFCNPPPLRVGEDKATVAERWAVRWLARFDAFTP